MSEVKEVLVMIKKQDVIEEIADADDAVGVTNLSLLVEEGGNNFSAGSPGVSITKN